MGYHTWETKLDNTTTKKITLGLELVDKIGWIITSLLLGSYCIIFTGKITLGLELVDKIGWIMNNNIILGLQDG